jgi:5-methylcytosine-specific restriction endonuclease McrA
VRRRQRASAGAPFRSARATVLAKTAGTCHVCGGAVGDEWQADHVVPFIRGGTSELDNYLPICVTCNRLRWSYPPTVFRMVIRLGIYAKDEIKRDTPLGRQLLRLATTRLARSHRRRVVLRRRGSVPPN